MSILTISNLHKAFLNGSQKQIIFEDFSLSVAKGVTLAITGESGSGKSTLLNLIAGLDSADKGTICCNNFDITTLDEEALSAYRNESLGFVFQTHFLLADFTAIENVMMPALLMGKSAAHSRELAQELLKKVGLEEKGKSLPMQLSGGESQRVSIARALINQPPLILADEPTGSLDQRNADAIQELLFSLVDQEQTTLILVTHDSRLAQLCQSQIKLAKYTGS